MEDADLEKMSAGLIRSCMRNTGQTCYISTRILALESRYEEVVDMVTKTTAGAPQGDPLDPTTVLGASANQSQYDSVLEHLKSAKEEGARVTIGSGKADFNGELADGLFIRPTVLADITPEILVAREEIFGPVITILKYTDLDEAMNTGSVGLNFFASNHAAPFGGRNDSGLGVEYGPEGLAAYLAYKSIHRR